MRKLFTLIIGITVFAACKSYYVSSSFDAKTSSHRVVAVLPVQMVFTGRQPKDITAEQIAEIEEAESRAFQISLHNEILASTRGGRKPFRVDFQSFTKTNAILEENGITIRESWDMMPEELAAKLGVDAVVRSSVEKERYMSDLASYGIEVAVEIVHILTEGAVWGILPGTGRIQKTHDIRANCQLNNGADGVVLWSDAYYASTDWSLPTEHIINGINQRFGKHFPYRLRK